MLTCFYWARSYEHSVKIILYLLKVQKKYSSCITSDIIVASFENRFNLFNVWS